MNITMKEKMNVENFMDGIENSGNLNDFLEEDYLKNYKENVVNVFSNKSEKELQEIFSIKQTLIINNTKVNFMCNQKFYNKYSNFINYEMPYVFKKNADGTPLLLLEDNMDNSFLNTSLNLININGTDILIESVQESTANNQHELILEKKECGILKKLILTTLISAISFTALFSAVGMIIAS